MAATIAQLHGFDLRVADNNPGAEFEMLSRRQNEPAADVIAIPHLKDAKQLPERIRNGAQ